MRLDDAEIDLLLSAVTTEAQRRGRLPKRQPQADAKLTGGRAAREEISHGLTKGKLNAVRAAFKAGVKPSAIARQFAFHSPMSGRPWLRDGTVAPDAESDSSSGYGSSIITLGRENNISG